MDTLKAQARTLRRQARREQRKAARREALKTRKCFFTWPLGHEWVNVGTAEQPCNRCVSCDTPRTFNDRRVSVPDTIPESFH